MTAYFRVSDAERDAGLPFVDTLEKAGRLFLEQGCLVLENVLTREFVLELQAGYARGIGGLDDQTLLDHGLVVGVRRVKVPLPLLPPFDNPRLWAHPILCSLLALWLDTRFMLDVCSLVTALPGALAQVPHRDNDFPYGFSDLSVQLPPFAITLAIPLIDFTEATGTTELFAGSHRQLLPSKDFVSPQGLRPQMKMGDVYFMDYRLVHGGTPNSSSQRRPMASLLYTRPWYVDTLNHLEQGLPSLVVPPELPGRLPPPLAYLLSRAKLPSGAGIRPQLPILPGITGLPL